MRVLSFLLANNSTVINDISSNLPSLIETIILAKLSALVIIFSTIFIVSQLVSTRYSPEFTLHFIDLKIFKRSFTIGLAIIIVDIVLRIIIPGVNSGYAIVISGIVTLLFIFFVYIIYNFVSDILSRSTPSYLLETYTKNLDSSTFIDKCVKSYNKNSMNLHPQQPIYDMARNAVQEGEYAVAQISENQIKESSLDFLDNTDKDKIDDMFVSDNIDEDITIRQRNLQVLFETPFDHYLSSLSRISAENDYEMLSKSPNKSISIIGQKGLEKSLEELTELSFLSIYNETIVKSPESVEKSSTHYARLLTAVQAEMDLLQTAVEEDCLELYCYLSTIGYEIMRGIDASIEEGPFEDSHPINEIIESQVQIYMELIKKHERYYQERNLSSEEILGRKKSRGDPLFRDYYGFEHPDPRISALITCRMFIFATTTRHLRGTEWLDDETVVPHAINYHWRKLVEFSSNHAPRSSAILIARRYIEMIVYHSVKDDVGIHAGGDIPLLASNANFKIIEEAFQQIYHPDERGYDLVDYNSYRGLGRLLIWTGIPSDDYSNDFLDMAREVHMNMKWHYYRRLNRKARQAVAAYESRKREGDRLPHPLEYRQQIKD